jgi:3'(2'), 5'-bisphosphate nucleotidase
MDKLARLTTQVCDFATQAGEKIMDFYEGGAEVTWKEDASPLTSADSASHDFLVESIRSLTPEVPIISEESEEAADGLIGHAKWFWLVDPLDGTKEFLKGTNEFTVNVALVEEGRPILGVVHAPALRLTYYGARNSGSWRKNGDGAPTPVSARRADPARLSVVASRDHAGPLVEKMLTRLSS